MSESVLALHPSYEVVLDGTLGPVYLACIEAMGVGRTETTSTFVVPVHESDGIAGILARLTARGLVILDVRQVPEGAIIGSSGTAGEPDAPA